MRDLRETRKLPGLSVWLLAIACGLVLTTLYLKPGWSWAAQFAVGIGFAHAALTILIWLFNVSGYGIGYAIGWIGGQYEGWRWEREYRQTLERDSRA